MFLFKKLVAPFLMPVPFCLALLLAGLLLVWFTRRQRAGRWLATLGALLLLALGYGFGANQLLWGLERRHAPVTDVSAAAGRVRWVVVLGGGSSADEGLPAALRLSEASLARLVEGVRLQRQLPGSRLLVSGGAVFGSGADSETMRALAVELGVSPDALDLDAVSPDTETQAEVVRSRLGTEEFYLVTSASHMRRALALFRKAGTNPLPAPTHFVMQANRGPSPGDFFPSTGNLRRAETATYEYLGLAWAKVRGRI
ncbi:MAG TPA: ElyC/SanA/YdcF family protein [Pyrinomonadaceae bacterium]|nr:ElyC/SanA/YdcF family protein [Pyrinomonadaceae bacterium]